MVKRILQSESYRLGVEKYRISPDEAINLIKLPADSIFDVRFGLRIGVPAHDWILRADNEGNLKLYSGGFNGPAAITVEPGAKDSLMTLTEDDKLVIDGDIIFTGDLFEGENSFTDTIKDMLKNIDWQNSVISRTTAKPADPDLGDRYIAPYDDGEWTKDYIYEWTEYIDEGDDEEHNTHWLEIVPNEGFAVWVEDDDDQLVWNATLEEWVAFGTTLHHNNLLSIQGGNDTERYHLLFSAYDNLKAQDQEVYTDSDIDLNSAAIVSSISVPNITSPSDFRVSISSDPAADIFIRTSDGNIGIRTETPSYDLDVAGTIRADEIRSTNSLYVPLIINSAGVSPLVIQDAGSPVVQIGSGKVSIGGPGLGAETLRVTGTVYFSDALTVDALITSDTSNSDEWKDAYDKRVDTWGPGLSWNSVTKETEVNVDNLSLRIESDILEIKPDGVKDYMVDWGLAADQISTTDIPEGTNLWYTDERVDDRVSNLLIAGIRGTGSDAVSWIYTDGSGTLQPVISLTPFSSADLSEDAAASGLEALDNGNAYYSGLRVDARVQAEDYTIAGTWTFNNNVTQANAPTNANHLANKGYVDSVIEGLDWQESVIRFEAQATVDTPIDIGDRYIASETSGSWTQNYLYEWEGSSWNEIIPDEGFAVYLENASGGFVDNVNIVWNGSTWVKFAAIEDHNTLLGLQGGNGSDEYYHLDATEFGFLNGQDQAVKSTDSPTFDVLTLTTRLDVNTIQPYSGGILNLTTNDLRMNPPSGSANFTIGVASGQDATIQFSEGGNWHKFGWDGVDNLMRLNFGADFSTNAGFNMDTSNNIGIGQAPSSDKITVSGGDVRFNGRDYRIYLHPDVDANYLKYNQFICNTSSNTMDFVNNGSGNIRINPAGGGNVIVPNGRIGIGANIPNDVVTIVSENNNGLTIREDDDTDDAIRLQGHTTSGVIEILSGPSVDISLAANGDIYFNNNGNVGIGTVSPAYLLDVSGNVRFVTSSGGNFVFQTDKFSFSNLGNCTMTSDGAVNMTSAMVNMRMQNAGTDSYAPVLKLQQDESINGISLWATGRVGIGVEQPDAMLEVLGNVIIDSGDLTITTGSLNVGDISATNLEVDDISGKTFAQVVFSDLLKLETSAPEFQFNPTSGIGGKIQVISSDLDIGSSTSFTFLGSSTTRAKIKSSSGVYIKTDNCLLSVTDSFRFGDAFNSYYFRLDTNGDMTLASNAVVANKGNTDVDTGTEDIDTFADTEADGCVWHYVVKSGANIRTGTIQAAWDSTGNTVQYNEVNTNDVGDTSNLSFSVDINLDNVRLRATAASDNWAVRVIRMSI